MPPLRAVWIPANAEHALGMTGEVALRTLYLRPDLAADAPPTCCVLDVSPLLRELILHCVALGMLREDDGPQARLLGVLRDLLRASARMPLSIPMPADPRARRVAERVLHEPGTGSDLGRLAEGSGAGRRTLERLFLVETGLSLGRWRQQVRLLQALRLLAAGHSVGDVARRVGYHSASAFVAMFRRTLGVTPARYF